MHISVIKQFKIHEWIIIRLHFQLQFSFINRNVIVFVVLLDFPKKRPNAPHILRLRRDGVGGQGQVLHLKMYDTSEESDRQYEVKQ